MKTIDAASIRLAALCDRRRGEEMSKAGMRWRCPSCLSETVPGKKKKGGHYHPKACPSCGYTLSEKNVAVTHIVVDDSEKDKHETVPFVDGDDINHRYIKVTPHKWLRRDAPGWKYKPAATYEQPKILIRQAGVGIWATYDETGVWCPQSVYLYRLKAPIAREGYRHEFVLAALLSRTLTYYVFKRFSEVDPARAHAKLTHARLASLPIPQVDFSDANQRKLHDEIADRARPLLDGAATLGGVEDLEIELKLRELWGLAAADSAYINEEFGPIPPSQAITDLFPDGVPGAAIYDAAA